MSAAAVVPTFNKGLKSPPVIPPSEDRVAAIIDYLTVTLPLDAVKEMLDGDKAMCSGLDAQHEDSQREVAQMLISHLGLGIEVNGSRGGFRHFYDHHFKLHTPEAEPCGLIAFGGERQHHTIMIQMTGAGCAHVAAWGRVRERLEALRARITRVDVAHDDYEGRYNVEHAIKWHGQGLFTTSGRPPALQVVGWDDGSGKSVYIGKNTGNQQLVVYEKGREQGARDDDEGVNWVRWEARFGSAYRDIPLDVLTDPVAYLVGHYPPLQYWIEAVCSRMRTSKVRAASNLAHSIRWARRQYGSLINLLAEHLPEPELFARFISRHVAKKTPPPWLKSNPFGASVINAAIEGRMELSP
ncbi:replication initiation factor domain-containing protein [Dyella humicola]|uniref:replication initiation factor domain-containing protein n=1 Tax=Dyella humicola TaxID=2992126 RepID=UPI0022588769|nr:replication initiation factor domain-containing protein [Dyella humicola]